MWTSTCKGKGQVTDGQVTWNASVSSTLLYANMCGELEMHDDLLLLKTNNRKIKDGFIVVAL